MFKHKNSKRKLHKQSRYFTIMLIPHSSGNTRSIKIPVAAFYMTLILFIVSVICFSSFVFATKHFKSVASSAYLDLEESAEINSQLNLEKMELNNKLHLKELDLEEATQRQRESYEERIRRYDEKAKELEQKLEDLNKARDEIYDQLSQKPYLPEISPVASFGSGARAAFMSTDDSGEEIILDIDTRFDLLDAEIDEQLLYFDYLLGEMETIKPYIDNYPTSLPVWGTVTSEHGTRANPFGGRTSENHKGIDIAVDTGTTVRATGGGKVTYAGWYSTFGYMVHISHGFGIVTRYAHNSQVLVEAGDYVSRGDAIAKSGNTGRSTGPHVHYEVLVNGVSQNPRNYIY